MGPGRKKAEIPEKGRRMQNTKKGKKKEKIG